MKGGLRQHVLKLLPGVGILEQHRPESELRQNCVDGAQAHGVHL